MLYFRGGACAEKDGPQPRRTPGLGAFAWRRDAQRFCRLRREADARGDAGVVWHGKPKYPEVTVQLIGQDGNAFAVMGAVVKALRAAKITKEERDTFMQEATKGDYNELLTTCMRWVTVQ